MSDPQVGTDRLRARRWDSTRELDKYWWSFVSETLDKEPLPACASVSPGVGKAGEPGVWRVSIAFAEHRLSAGSRLVLEVPAHWQLHLGRPVRIHPK